MHRQTPPPALTENVAATDFNSTGSDFNSTSGVTGFNSTTDFTTTDFTTTSGVTTTSDFTNSTT